MRIVRRSMLAFNVFLLSILLLMACMTYVFLVVNLLQLSLFDALLFSLWLFVFVIWNLIATLFTSALFTTRYAQLIAFAVIFNASRPLAFASSSMQFCSCLIIRVNDLWCKGKGISRKDFLFCLVNKVFFSLDVTTVLTRAVLSADESLSEAFTVHL